MQEIRPVTTKVIYVDDSESSQDLAKALDAKYKIVNVSSFNGGIVYVLAKGAK